MRPSPLAADFPDADTSSWSSLPRPALTAYEGADLDAYWLDGDLWRHCQTGIAWLDCGGDLILGKACRACVFCQAQGRSLS